MRGRLQVEHTVIQAGTSRKYPEKWFIEHGLATSSFPLTDPEPQ
jgi:hypothetical protein